jgi:integrase
MPQRKSVPKLRLHKPSGRAVVTIDGRDFYCGSWGSSEARTEYDRLIAQWLANGRCLRHPTHGSYDLTITEVVARYWRFAETHYTVDGKPSRELVSLRDAIRPLKKLYGHTLAAEFGPVGYKTVRSAMVKSGLARTTINYRLGKVRRLFKWAVEQELVPADCYHRLQAVAPLRAGRDGVRESEPVKPVSDDLVDRTLPFLPPPIRAMVEVQRLTGMRPGEVVTMTTGQLDRSGAVWLYRPARHKTAGIGKVREIPIGPKGQLILRAWLKADPDAPLFSPCEAAEAHHAARRSNRKTPTTPSSRARTREKTPKRAPGREYCRTAYATAIRRACAKAGVPNWSPNQLRHSLATLVRQRFGLEAAQVILGHSRADVTQVYAERNQALAVSVMSEIG